MEAPIKLIGNVGYLNTYQKPGKAGIVTTGYGSILEANDEAAKLFNVTSSRAMKNVPIVSYAHRSSARDFRALLNGFRSADHLDSNLLVLRPRSGVPFKANVIGKVIARGQRIVLIFWEVSVESAVTNLKTG
jgi:hypothetical protein